MQYNSDKRYNLLTLEKKVQETCDSVSFFFRTDAHILPDFKPGQFINIGVLINEKHHYRPYSISSLSGDAIIQLTIKRVMHGLVSNWLIDHLNPGDQITSHGIAGNFNIIDHDLNKSVLFISAGCGIVPIMAMTRYLLYTRPEFKKDIHFIHCARDENNLIYEKEVSSFSHSFPIFKPVFYVDQTPHAPNLKMDNLRQGPLTKEHLHQHLITANKDACTIFLCGPTGFMAQVQRDLEALDFNQDYFQQESFTPETPSSAQITRQNAADSEILCTVSLPEYNFTTDIPSGKNLLEVLQEGNMRIIAACQSGICGSCKCQVTQGTIEAHHQAVAHGLLTEKEVAEGYTLACSSTVIDDITVHINS